MGEKSDRLYYMMDYSDMNETISWLNSKMLANLSNGDVENAYWMRFIRGMCA